MFTMLVDNLEFPVAWLHSVTQCVDYGTGGVSGRELAKHPSLYHFHDSNFKSFLFVVLSLDEILLKLFIFQYFAKSNFAFVVVDVFFIWTLYSWVLKD